MYGYSGAELPHYNFPNPLETFEEKTGATKLSSERLRPGGAHYRPRDVDRAISKVALGLHIGARSDHDRHSLDVPINRSQVKGRIAGLLRHRDTRGVVVQ